MLARVTATIVFEHTLEGNRDKILAFAKTLSAEDLTHTFPTSVEVSAKEWKNDKCVGELEKWEIPTLFVK